MAWQIGMLTVGGPALAGIMLYRRRARVTERAQHERLIASVVALRDRFEPANDDAAIPPFAVFARGVRALQAAHAR